MSATTISSIDALMKDLFPAPGDRIKQWVADARREARWETETCPTFKIHDHEDNTGGPCRNSFGRVSWAFLAHDCCSTCNELHEEFKLSEAVAVWIVLRSQRPPKETDREKYSDEIEPDRTLDPHPFFKAMKKGLTDS